ncbi:MAG: iron ABC transporter permease, partial [Pseudomonadota bacterium]
MANVVQSLPRIQENVAQRFRARSRTRSALLLVALAVLLVCVLADIAWGPSNMPIAEVAATIFNPWAADVQTSVIVWDLRLPIAIMALMIGAMLGIAGAEMQTILNNPLADPFTLGISSAASFGAALAIVLQVNLVPFAGPFLVTANAFVLALSTSLILYACTRMRGVTAETMVLVGIAMLFTFNALLSLMQYGASEIQLAQIVFWMMGSLGRATWTKVGVCFAMLLIVLPYFMSRNWALTALRLGDDK